MLDRCPVPNRNPQQSASPNRAIHPLTRPFPSPNPMDESSVAAPAAAAPDASQSAFSVALPLPDITVYRDSDSSDEHENPKPSDSSDSSPPPQPLPLNAPARISPEPHISSQFYTFNRESHALMASCILDRRIASPEEIRLVTPRAVLCSWRSVWKDRNEDTAYLTAWKRIQDKLNADVDQRGSGSRVLFFKNNPHQFVSHVEQWQDIVSSFHGDADLKHLGLKDTIDRIKQVWTVGAKFYGIPESFIRVCVASCPVCSDSSAPGSSAAASNQRTKRRRFEYTESFELPAKDVPQRLQQLAAKHKVVLCIRQKYIRHKPFMAEVKDYACHRAGEPVSKRSRVLKREPYASKRCGCGFRIRAIVPIANYNEKDKTFVYHEEGTAVFKLYAVHSGHEPGPLDGNARIIHRVVGHKGNFLDDQETVYGLSGDIESDVFSLMGKDEDDSQLTVLHQLQELRSEIVFLEEKISKIPLGFMNSVSQELSDIMHRIRSLGEEASHPSGLLLDKQRPDDVLVDSSEIGNWGDPHHVHMYDDGKESDMIDDEDGTFEHTLGVPPWDRMQTEPDERKVLIRDNCKPDKWLKEFDEKSILGCEDSKLIKPLRRDGTIVNDANLAGLHVDGFYQDSTKWYDSPCGLDPTADCGDGSFRHEEIV